VEVTLTHFKGEWKRISGENIEGVDGGGYYADDHTVQKEGSPSINIEYIDV